MSFNKFWIYNPADYIRAHISETEEKKLINRILEEITKNKKPVQNPHLLVTLGAPGSGKSTIAQLFIKKHNKEDANNYVELDYDLLAKYHPDFGNVLNIPTIGKKKLKDVGYALGTRDTMYLMHRLGYEIELYLFNNKYNIILQSHNMDCLPLSFSKGYVSSLLYIYTNLEIAKKRALDRAFKTGKFLSDTLKGQDQIIEDTFYRYEYMAPWYALWANEFYIVSNNGKLPEYNDFILFNPHRQWPDSINDMYGGIREMVKK